jgi:glycosyltransferase involved in cell wall biosynthesis
MSIGKQVRNGIVGLVVSTNDGDILENCLASLSFCDHLIVVDNNSSDMTAEIARKAGAEVRRLPRTAPIVEEIHADILPTLQHEWICIVDPDEVIDPTLGAQLQQASQDLPVETGLVRAPSIYYFGQRPLQGTPWGYRKNKRILFRSYAIDVSRRVHDGIRLRRGFHEICLPQKSGNVLHHYWMPSHSVFFEKHIRYLQREGHSRFAGGRRTNFASLLLMLPRQFYYSLINRRGYKDGILGLWLSVLWAWYQTAAEWELRKYQIAAQRMDSQVSSTEEGSSPSQLSSLGISVQK